MTARHVTMAGEVWEEVTSTSYWSLDGRCFLRRDLRRLETIVHVDGHRLPKTYRTNNGAARGALAARGSRPAFNLPPLDVTAHEFGTAQPDNPRPFLAENTALLVEGLYPWQREAVERILALPLGSKLTVTRSRGKTR